MGWTHPGISMEDLMKLIKGFVDILILTSGFQSSGRDAHWNPVHITMAFRWSLFFENVLSNLSCLDGYEESLKALDEALSALRSADSFPQGLKQLSSTTLTNAREFLVEHFINVLPLKGSLLKAFLTATITLDLNELAGKEHDRLSLYLNNLNLLKTTTPMSLRRELSNDNSPKSPEASLTKYTVQKLEKRWSMVSDIITIEKSLTAVSEKIKGSINEFGDNLSKVQLMRNDAPVFSEQVVGFMTWNSWRSKILCFFMDKRAVRMVSGASMIFSAPKIQWLQVFYTLNNPGNDDLCDIVELLLFGCITSRWSTLIECVMSVSYNPITTSEQYEELCNLLQGKSHDFESEEKMKNSKENEVLEYLIDLLGSQIRPLWSMSPVLAAIAIPSWSPLFRFYVSELGNQIRGDSSKMRHCGCNPERKAHYECEIAERIWCLYIFHVSGAAGQNACPNFCKSIKMKMSSSLRNRFFSHQGKRIEDTGSEISFVGGRRRASLACFRCDAPRVIRKVAQKLKLRCKRALREDRKNARFGYDLRSYALNFDNAFY